MNQISNRLASQLAFVREIEKLKTVCRRNLLVDLSRAESSAEHSWHVALMGFVLSEHAREPVDPMRVVKMLLVHDLVEIDAGDTFCYSSFDEQEVHEKEQRAAERVFGLLPTDQADEFRRLWDEFEAAKTPEAVFARALDRLNAFVGNLQTKGAAWKKHDIRSSQVERRMGELRERLPALWPFVQSSLSEAVTKGWLADDQLQEAPSR